MLGINTNVNSLVAQQNLNGSQSALSQAITSQLAAAAGSEAAAVSDRRAEQG
ncbi:hypothetical protein [Burkholderia glumae]|uniref:hypothetical protein n=1 Tax=Burkholderia glumae TaxID=337 RepID=UPI002036E9C9|nr:hypothetical protein [Burkholderia glumae]MCM2546911.1 hypothetical protein [Burkholderia glumae]